MQDREGLIARITQMRRSRVRAQERNPSPDPVLRTGDPVLALEARVIALEQLVQGLQDSVHRESTRLNREIVDLHAEIAPAALSRTLSEHAREHGL